MTEADWLTADDPAAMLRCDLVLASSRKLRLCGCAATRAFGDSITDPRQWKALDAAERYADGELTGSGLRRWADQMNRLCLEASRAGSSPALVKRVRNAVANCCSSNPAYYQKVVHWLCHLGSCVSTETLRVIRSTQMGIVRDIFGNPFRPVAFASEWRTATVVSLACGMYESRDFSAIPILADALQDAGCDDEQLLGHSRDPGPHVRGCWVVDLVVGRE